MGNTFSVLITLDEKTCGSCGGVFALNRDFIEHARNNKGGYHCPYCDTSWSWRESEADKLRQQLTASKCETLAERKLKEDARKLLEKSQRKLKRSNKGVCTCCNRSFENLQRHMKTKHTEKLKP